MVDALNPTASVTNMFSGVGNTFNGFGAGIAQFMGTWGVFVFQMTIVLGVVFAVYWFGIKHNHKVIIKTFGHNRLQLTRGMKTMDRKTKTRGFKILGVDSWNGDAVSENYIGYMKTMFGTKPYVVFAYDKDGNLHPVSFVESDSFLKINVLTSVEKDIFINQVEKANRKYPLSAESWVKTTMMMLVVCLVIVFGGTSYVSYKQSKGMDSLSKAMQINALTNDKLANAAAGVSASNVVAPPGTNPTVVTPFNNVLTPGG